MARDVARGVARCEVCGREAGRARRCVACSECDSAVETIEGSARRRIRILAARVEAAIMAGDWRGALSPLAAIGLIATAARQKGETHLRGYGSDPEPMEAGYAWRRFTDVVVWYGRGEETATHVADAAADLDFAIAAMRRDGVGLATAIEIARRK